MAALLNAYWPLAGLGLVLAIALVLAWRFNRRVGGPLADVLKSVERLSSGDWTTHVEVPAGTRGTRARHRARAPAHQPRGPRRHGPRARHHAGQHERRGVRDLARRAHQAGEPRRHADARLVADGAFGARTGLCHLRPGPPGLQHRAGDQRGARAHHPHACRADDPGFAVGLDHERRGSALPGLHLRRPQHHRAQARRAAHPLPRALRHADQDPEPAAVPALPAAGDRAHAPRRARTRADLPRPRPLQGGQRHLRPRRGRPRARDPLRADEQEAAARHHARPPGGRRICPVRRESPGGDRQPRRDRRARPRTPRRARPAVPAQPARALRHRQHRHRAVPARRRQRRRPDPRRGRGDVLLQAERRQQPQLLHAGNERRGGRAADDEGQAAPRGRARRARSSCTSPRWTCATGAWSAARR